MSVFTGPSQAARGIALRDAQAAAYAADGFTRASGRPSIVVGRGLAESLELISGLATAWSDKLPLVAVCELGRDRTEPVLGAAGAVTRGTFRVEPGGEPAKIADEIGSALSRRAPLLVTAEQAQPIVELLETRLARIAERAPDSAGAGEAARQIAQATRGWKRAVVLLGRGAIGAVEPSELASVAARLDAPVLLTASATTLPAQELARLTRTFAGRGALIPSGNLVWVKALARADGVLAFGTALSEVDGFGLRDLRLTRAPILRVDLDQAPRAPRHTLLRADAGPVVSELSQILPERGEGRRVRSLRAAGERWRRTLAEEARACRNSAGIEPRFAAHCIVEGAPDGTLFASEGGSCGMWLWAYLWLRPYVFPVQHGTLGVTIPYALGASTALPQAPIWAVVGDGGFFYNAAELATLAARGRPIVVFVFNDRSWSAIRIGQTVLYRGRYVGTDLPRGQYAKYAACLGCEGRVVTTPGELERAIDEARNYAGRVPLVVDVHLPRDHVPYAGANFVLAELDGAMAALALPSAFSAFSGVLSGRLPLATLRSLIRVGS
jgi:thiamine pyrophosphate-dependent acetolactate synthase large subunit-like protein